MCNQEIQPIFQAMLIISSSSYWPNDRYEYPTISQIMITPVSDAAFSWDDYSKTSIYRVIGHLEEPR